MKKIYLTALSVAFLFGANAQEKSTLTNKANDAKAAVSVKASTAEAPIYNTKAIYLTEGFEGTFPPTGWSVVSGPASTITVPATQDWHQVTTSGNPGSSASVNYQNSTDVHDQFLITPAVTMPATGNVRVAFDFSTSIYWHAITLGGTYDNVDVTVLASTDAGTTWDPILWQEDSLVLLDASYSNDWATYEWKRAFVDLSAYVGGAPVTIGFHYKGIDGAQFALDNVTVEDVPDNDIEIQNAWTGDVVLDYDYSKVPDEQVKPMRVGAALRNIGAQDQTGFSVNYDIIFGGSSVDNGTTTATLTAGEQDTVWFDTGYTPTASGVYTVNFSLQADDNTANDDRAATLETTDFIYAHDFDGAGIFRFDQDDVVSMANQFILEADATLRAADVEFETGTTVDLYVQVNVWEVDPALGIQGALTQVGVTDFIVPASAIGSAGLITTIPFPTAIPLVAGAIYMLEVLKTDAGPGRLFLGGSDAGDDDFSTVCYGPFGASNAINYFNGWGFAPAIRMNFDPTIGLDENTLTGVSIYPNPSEGIVNITNDNNTENSIEVYDLLGNSILSTSANAATTVDLSSNAAGIYMIIVSNENGSIVERVSIK